MYYSDNSIAQVPKQTDSNPSEPETSIDELLGLQVWLRVGWGGGCGELCVLRAGDWHSSLGLCTRAYLPTFLAHQARGVGGQQWDVFGGHLRPLGHSRKQ